MTSENWFFLAIGSLAGALVTIIISIAVNLWRSSAEEHREFEEQLRRIKGL